MILNFVSIIITFPLDETLKMSRDEKYNTAFKSLHDPQWYGDVCLPEISYQFREKLRKKQTFYVVLLKKFGIVTVISWAVHIHFFAGYH